MTLLPESGTLGSRLAALGLLIGVILGLGFGLVEPWVAKITAQRDEIAQTQHRIALAEQQLARLKSSGQKVASVPSVNLASLAITAPSATRASARLVQLAKEQIAVAGCNVVSLEARPASPAALGLQLEARAKLVFDTPHLQALLHRVEAMRPVMLISALRVRSRAGRAEESNLLDIELDLSAFLIQTLPAEEVKS